MDVFTVQDVLWACGLAVMWALGFRAGLAA